MHNPFHDELTPSSGREQRINRALRAHSARKRAIARAALEPSRPAPDRWSNRLAIAGAVAVIPLVVFVALLIVSHGGPSIDFFGNGSSNVPPGTGHSAPAFGATVTDNAPAAAAATNAAIVPTPTIIIEPDTVPATPNTCTPVNAAGTPVADSECPATPSPTPSSPARPAPRNPSAR